MILLIDEPLTPSSHSHLMTGVIREHTKETIRYLEISPGANILAILRTLQREVTGADVVLCPWAVPVDDTIDMAFSDLAERCWVVVAAGNSSQAVEHWSPARAEGVITVGTLNKAGKQASLSNFSTTKKLKWVVGTNYHFEGRPHSGTSISAALYAAFLAEAIAAKDASLLGTLISQHATTQKLY